MKRVKLFKGDDTKRVQEKIDKWLEKNPTFDVDSTSMVRVGNYSTFMISIVYRDVKEGLSLNS